MSVTLDKINDHKYAVIEFGELILRGKIVKRHHSSVTIKVDSCQGRSTREDYPIMVGHLHRFMIDSESCHLYR